MSLVRFEVTMVGTRPLLMHNSRLADPTDEIVLAKAKYKGCKTLEALTECGRLEWLGGLYTDQAGKPAIPARNVLGMLGEAAKIDKLGARVKRAGFLFDQEFVTVKHARNGASVEKLWEDPAFRERSIMRQKNVRIVRVRPRFFPWQVVVAGSYNPEALDPAQLALFFEKAGDLVGLGDSRPMFGRFRVGRLEVGGKVLVEEAA